MVRACGAIVGARHASPAPCAVHTYCDYFLYLSSTSILRARRAATTAMLSENTQRVFYGRGWQRAYNDMIKKMRGAHFWANQVSPLHD